MITLHIYGLFGLQIVINGRKVWILIYLGEFNFFWGNVNAFSMHYLRELYGYFFFIDYSVDVLDVTVFHYHSAIVLIVRAKENRIFYLQLFGSTSSKR